MRGSPQTQGRHVTTLGFAMHVGVHTDSAGGCAGHSYAAERGSPAPATFPSSDQRSVEWPVAPSSLGQCSGVLLLSSKRVLTKNRLRRQRPSGRPPLPCLMTD